MENHLQLTFVNEIFDQVSFTPPDELWKRLRDLRKEKNISMKELSQKLGIPRGTYNGYESTPDKVYHRQPDYKNLIKLASFYNVSIDYLLCQTENKAPHTAAIDAREAIKNSHLQKREKDYVLQLLAEIEKELKTG